MIRFQNKVLDSFQNYNELFEKNQFFYKEPFRSELLNKAEIRQGGEYWPRDCNTLFSVAIIVPYRNRPSQLKSFLDYMHNVRSTFTIKRCNANLSIFLVLKEATDSL